MQSPVAVRFFSKTSNILYPTGVTGKPPVALLYLQSPPDIVYVPSGTVVSGQNDTSLTPDCKVRWYTCSKYVAPTTWCKGLVCEDMTFWTDDASNEWREMRCNTVNASCEYRCKSGSYEPGGAQIIGSPKQCVECPEHAICDSPSAPPCCAMGYYLIDHNYIGIGINRGKKYECLRCPSVAGLDPAVIGTTALTCPAEPPTPSFITSCYIMANTEVHVPEGTFTFTRVCNYSEDE